MKTNYLCKDCKHCFITLRNQLFYAFHDSEFRYSCRRSYEEARINFNPVTGSKIVKNKYELCTLSRLNPNKCGPDAKYWAPKNKKDLFLALIK